MNREEGAHFVGAYISFPVQEKIRRVEILKALLALEDKLSFKRIRFGPILGQLSTTSFSEERLQTALVSLEGGESDYLQLLNYRIGEDWVRGYDTSVFVNWTSSVSRPSGSRSPVGERFGDAGSVTVGYPQSKFSADSVSLFQERLLDLLAKLWSEGTLYWAFVHQGFHPTHPASVGQDDVFRATRDSFPLTSFDANIRVPIGIFKEWIGGAFWTNFLSSYHVSRLGGIDKLLEERPCESVTRLSNDGAILQVASSPITADPQKYVGKYQKLRRYLAPILMETGEDMMRIQREVLGSWKPPADAERKWQENLAAMRKQNQAESMDHLA